MKRIFIATLIAANLAAATLMATAGFAQEAIPADHNPAMPAVVTSGTESPEMPAAGRNSFTQKQAAARLNKQGYSKIANFKKDSDGIWRGTAMMNGTRYKVSVDYQGNITAE